MSAQDELLLKWGTLKGWNIVSAAARAAARRYADAGEVSLSAMEQRDTPEQKQALCDWIDAVAASGGEIQNDWSGEVMTAEAAKKYILEYRS